MTSVAESPPTEIWRQEYPFESNWLDLGAYRLHYIDEGGGSPLLMVHGDVDARVRYFNFKDYKKAMERAGKSSKGQFLTIKGADHGGFWSFNHNKTLYTKMLDFLANDCGPGGL